MIISRTPLRISFFGGGTDYPDFYKEYGGEVLVSSINKYSYIFLKPIPPIFKYKIKISYSKTEQVNHINEIQHPSVRECLNYTGINDPLEIAYMGDLPALTGLGSSSSFTVGLLKALYTYKKKNVSNIYLGKLAIHIEQNLIKERVGSQDQMSTASGNINHIYFSKSNIHIKPLLLSDKRKSELNRKLLLFYTGITRQAHEIIKEQHQKTILKENNEILFKMKDIVRKGVSILCSKHPLDQFGILLNETWMLKKKLSSAITNPLIDEAYEAAIKNGGLGGKLLGAGGGGFLLIYAPENKHTKLRNALSHLKEISFKFEKEGSAIVHNDKINV